MDGCIGVFEVVKFHTKRHRAVVQAVDKKKARLNCIHHLLSQLPYQEVPHAPVVLPERVRNPEYFRQPVPASMYVPEVY